MWEDLFILIWKNVKCRRCNFIGSYRYSFAVTGSCPLTGPFLQLFWKCGFILRLCWIFLRPTPLQTAKTHLSFLQLHWKSHVDRRHEDPVGDDGDGRRFTVSRPARGLVGLFRQNGCQPACQARAARLRGGINDGGVQAPGVHQGGAVLDGTRKHLVGGHALLPVRAKIAVTGAHFHTAIMPENRRSVNGIP